MIPSDSGSSLEWEDVLPVAFVPGPPVTEERMVAHRIAANLRILHTCEALEERRAERDEDLGGAPETARLEKKIDLLIEMVGHWVAQSGARPPAVLAGLSAAGLRWRPESGLPRPGAVGIVQVHLREGVAEALCLPGEIGAQDADGQASMVFRGLAEAEVDALERFVFRQHRRSVAGRRKGL